ncbi:Uncharacterised protein [Mycobacteroides abscessus subsp. abscessus]|nr:Uncharacterised protein [Mycobacteroides abscessus subsp. abscessus]
MMADPTTHPLRSFSGEPSAEPESMRPKSHTAAG